MDKAVAKGWRMHIKDGEAEFVIGSTDYEDIRIDNAGSLGDCMDRAGSRKINAARRKVSLKIMTPYLDARAGLPGIRHSARCTAKSVSPRDGYEAGGATDPSVRPALDDAG